MSSKLRFAVSVMVNIIWIKPAGKAITWEKQVDWNKQGSIDKTKDDKHPERHGGYEVRHDLVDEAAS